MRDLQSKNLICLKAALFLLIGALSTASILLESLRWQTLALLTIIIWSSCRAYYFAFYVLEHYVDPTYRFTGLLSLAKHILKNRKHPT